MQPGADLGQMGDAQDLARAVPHRGLCRQAPQQAAYSFAQPGADARVQLIQNHQRRGHAAFFFGPCATHVAVVEMGAPMYYDKGRELLRKHCSNLPAALLGLASESSPSETIRK